MPEFDPISTLPPAIALDGSEEIPLNQAGTTKRATTAMVSRLAGIAAGLEFVIVGSPLDVGVQNYVVMAFSARIDAVYLLGNQAGNVVVDFWKCTYAQFDAGATAPTAADSITGGDYPSLVAETKSLKVNLDAWNRQLNVGDVLATNFNSVSGLARLTVALILTRTVT